MTHALVRGAPRASARKDDEQVTEWALAARGGDPAAVERFVQATYSDVWRFTAHLSGDVHGADDLTQDTFLRALGGLPRFAGRSGARTWLLSIARRAVIDRYRHAAARPRISDAVDWRSAAEGTQPVGVPGFEEGVAMLELLDTLQAPRREAFVLTQLLGLSYAEAASTTGCPIGTVRSRVARARDDLVVLLKAAETAPRPGAVHRQHGTEHQATEHSAAEHPSRERETAEYPVRSRHITQQHVWSHA
ncbi:sigma-70 family RNA polymerase sigma factor [Streptomyces sp. SID13666]|uniref:sigma-70 family RNA polymerase sigma factor n=1 Tax=unclassified Streptomyces TaxID=2593676 RepID=UPI0013BF1095|nr:sigma-70 family RNA polymerase sigma factor [Streptomyces sp. SID13666]NEA70825.1 sigma-70 family RNA polymerase sigma factor [Streptomyces sp. SID13588]